MTHRALDFDFRVSADPELAPALERALAPLRNVDSARHAPEIIISGHDGHWTVEERDVTLRATSIGIALARTLELINQRAAASLGPLIPVHAAAVRSPESAVLIALAGSSGAGKSTLGAAAIGAGWGFVAEEITAVDPFTNVVRSFHRSIGLRRGGAAALGIDYPDDPIHSEVFPWPIPLGSRADGAALSGIALVNRLDPIGIEEVRPAHALAELIEHCVVPDDTRLVQVFHDLEALVRSIPVVRLGYRSPSEGIAYLHELEQRWS